MWEIHGAVVLRKNATTCGWNNEMGVDQSAEWLALENTDTGQIRQAGFDAEINVGNNQMKYCRFWATGLGTPHLYHCNQDGTGTAERFMVSELNGADIIYDCGSAGGYGNCAPEGADDHDGPETAALIAENTNPCNDHMMGSSASWGQYGTASEPVQATWGTYLVSQDAPWAPYGTTISGGGQAPAPGCNANYGKNDYHNIYLGTFDWRN